jgi:hypothetical protein
MRTQVAWEPVTYLQPRPSESLRKGNLAARIHVLVAACRRKTATWWEKLDPIYASVPVSSPTCECEQSLMAGHDVL